LWVMSPTSYQTAPPRGLILDEVHTSSQRVALITALGRLQAYGMVTDYADGWSFWRDLMYRDYFG
ncbi:MAG: hypothetical protein KC594_18585, partial [Nitrospira sp.]|nr:hypothetical protein [Nitrospira sp.]